MLVYPEVSYGPWRGALVEAVMDVHRRRPVDLAVATANPNVDLEAAHQLHLATGVPFVMDQRDAWNLNTFTEEERGGTREKELEAAYIRDASEVWFVNEPLRDWHAERHRESADHIHSVLNGFDRELAPAPVLQPPPPGKPLTFGYIGTITPNTFVREFLEGWASAREQDPEMATATADLWGYLGFFAGRDDASAGLIEQYADRGVRFRGPVPKTEVPQRYAEFDALLLLLGTGRFVTSGKVFEYMASALPIVSVHSPELAVSGILRDYPLWFEPASMEPAAIGAALVAAAHAARTADEATRRACAEVAAQYDRRRILQPRLLALRELVEARRGAVR
jgi:glycosyltransferase involved in cell wall biosynthesis